MKKIFLITLAFIGLVSTSPVHAIFDSAKLYLKINALKDAKTIAEAEKLNNEAISMASDMGVYDKKQNDIKKAYDAATENIERKSKNAGNPSTWSQIKQGISEKINDRKKSKK